MGHPIGAKPVVPELKRDDVLSVLNGHHYMTADDIAGDLCQLTGEYFWGELVGSKLDSWIADGDKDIIKGARSMDSLMGYKVPRKVKFKGVEPDSWGWCAMMAVRRTPGKQLGANEILDIIEDMFPERTASVVHEKSKMSTLRSVLANLRKMRSKSSTFSWKKATGRSGYVYYSAAKDAVD